LIRKPQAGIIKIASELTLSPASEKTNGPLGRNAGGSGEEKKQTLRWSSALV
jgi:hypothetical protein